MEKSTKGRKNFHLSNLARYRWNLLDLINIVGKGAVPTYLFLDVDRTWAENLRTYMNKLGQKVTVTAILLKAIAIAQRAHPDTRTALLPWGKIVTFNNIIAGFTVERFVGSQPALFFGTIEAPDIKPIQEISKELKEHAEADFNLVCQLQLQNKFTGLPWLFRRFILWLGLRYPSVRLKYMGATFGLSSLGKFNIKAVIPPCVTTSTFGVGKVEPRAVVRDGKIEICQMMTLTLNFDHRLIDGAPAARFLNDIGKLMEGGLEKHIQEELHELGLSSAKPAEFEIAKT